VKPPPGQKRLIKFPKKVLPVPGEDGQKFDEAGFYAWEFDMPTPPWVYVVSALGAVGVILICLFPVAPSWVKISVVYFLAGLLTLMVGMLMVRGVVALVSYIFTGRTVWIFPNVLDDNKPLADLFQPMVDVVEPACEDGKGKALHYGSRFGLAGLVAVILYVLYAHSPGQDAVKKNAFKYRDELFEFLNVHNTRSMISEGQKNTTETPPNEGRGSDGDPANDTSSSNSNTEL